MSSNQGLGNLFDALEQVGNVATDDAFWENLPSLFLQEGIEQGKGAVLQPICRHLAEQRLAMEGQDADSYLRWLGIEEGVKGIDFQKSEFCPGGSDDIKIVARYKVHVLELLGVDWDFNFEQCAYTKAW